MARLSRTSSPDPDGRALPVLFHWKAGREPIKMREIVRVRGTGGNPRMSPKPDEAKARAGKVRYFGDYELLEEISHRSGVVYRARQVSLNREVALKLVPAGALGSLAEVQRF